MSTNAVRRRIAQLNGVAPAMLTEGRTMWEMISDIRMHRAQLLDQKRVWGADTPQNGALADAVNSLSDAILAIEEFQDLKRRGDTIR